MLVSTSQVARYKAEVTRLKFNVCTCNLYMQCCIAKLKITITTVVKHSRSHSHGKSSFEDTSAAARKAKLCTEGRLQGCHACHVTTKAYDAASRLTGHMILGHYTVLLRN